MDIFSWCYIGHDRNIRLSFQNNLTVCAAFRVKKLSLNWFSQFPGGTEAGRSDAAFQFIPGSARRAACEISMISSSLPARGSPPKAEWRRSGVRTGYGKAIGSRTCALCPSHSECPLSTHSGHGGTWFDADTGR